VADEHLASWNDGPAATAIREFVERVTTEGSPEFVPPDERVAVFDNDGTLWCEKPMPIELDFILQRLAAMAEEDASLRRPMIDLLGYLAANAGGPSRPGLRLLVLHDDPEREFDYVAGAERALEEAKARSWTVVSVKRDWATVFG
jgi:hypothetical protein